MDPTNWNADPDSGSIYCPRWLQPFALRHVRWWFWAARLWNRLKRGEVTVTGSNNAAGT